MSKTKKTILLIVLSAIVFSVGYMFVYLNEYYKADDVAQSILTNGEGVTTVDDFVILTPTDNDKEIGIIFYPGAKVENIAYLPILQKLQNEGYTCVLLKMPFNMAIFDVDKADEVYQHLPNIETWYMLGHSMGGSMTTNYAQDRQDIISGAILLGAYIYGDYPSSDTLTIYGSFNDGLEEYIDYTDNIIKIEGGNHAQFGNYGEQDGDPPATISQEEQQNIAVSEIVKFIDSREL